MNRLIDANVVRRRLQVAGVVQGVGFRPFVYRLAHDLALAGWVRNDAAGVTIEVQGDPARIDRLARRVARRGAGAGARRPRDRARVPARSTRSRAS